MSQAAYGRTRRGERGGRVLARVQRHLDDRRGDQHQLHGTVTESHSLNIDAAHQ